jgi:hypothetical protein
LYYLSGERHEPPIALACVLGHEGTLRRPTPWVCLPGRPLASGHPTRKSRGGISRRFRGGRGRPLHDLPLLKKNQKDFLVLLFACWELSRVNSFSCFCFSFLKFASFQKTKNSKNISVCFSEFLFCLLSHTKEKTTMKKLSGSHMHYY